MTSQSPTKLGAGETVLLNRSAVLKDANGTLLGYVTEMSPDSVTVFTSKNYFISLGWNGVPTDGACWFTGANGTGTLFYIAPNTDRLFGFAVSIGGKAYVAATVDAAGLAVSDPAITGFQSYYSGSGTITNAAGAVPAGHLAYSLKTASFADVGIPASIATLREFVFQ
jgi:hypothetical protein